jgi:hypothetical protein
MIIRLGDRLYRVSIISMQFWLLSRMFRVSTFQWSVCTCVHVSVDCSAAAACDRYDILFPEHFPYSRCFQKVAIELQWTESIRNRGQSLSCELHRHKLGGLKKWVVQEDRKCDLVADDTSHRSVTRWGTGRSSTSSSAILPSVCQRQNQRGVS